MTNNAMSPSCASHFHDDCLAQGQLFDTTGNMIDLNMTRCDSIYKQRVRVRNIERDRERERRGREREDKQLELVHNCVIDGVKKKILLFCHSTINLVIHQSPRTTSRFFATVCETIHYRAVAVAIASAMALAFALAC